MPPGKIPAAVNTPWQRRLPPVRPWVTSCGRIEAAPRRDPLASGTTFIHTISRSQAGPLLSRSLQHPISARLDAKEAGPRHGRWSFSGYLLCALSCGKLHRSADSAAHALVSTVRGGMRSQECFCRQTARVGPGGLVSGDKRICPPCLPNARCRETPDDAAKARRKNLAPVAASLAPLSATAKRESMEDGAGAVIFRRLQGCGRYCSSEARGFSSSGAASMVSLTTLAPAGGGGVPVARICS